MRRALIACRATETNDALARAGRREAAWEVLTPARALAELREFSGEYASCGDVFAETAEALATEAGRRLAGREAAPAAAAV